MTTCKTVAYIGTHPRHCHINGLIWRLGPLAIFEESLSPENVALVHALGPSYIGCFQAVTLSDMFEVRIFSSTYFIPLVSFYTPLKHEKTSGFLMFSGGVERNQLHEMG